MLWRKKGNVRYRLQQGGWFDYKRKAGGRTPVSGAYERPCGDLGRQSNSSDHIKTPSEVAGFCVMEKKSQCSTLFAPRGFEPTAVGSTTSERRAGVMMR